MSDRIQPKGVAATALRAAGYMPLPRLWVTSEQMDLIQYMTRQNADEVNRIRHEALQKEEAWNMHNI